MRDWTSIDEALEKGVTEKVFPGASLLVAHQGKVLHQKFVGFASLLPKQEVLTEKHIFDVASLTKPVVTSSLALLACKENLLSVDDTLSKFFDVSKHPDKKNISVKNLLQHNSGLPAWKPYFENTSSSPAEWTTKILQEPLEAPISSKRIYSDLGFILLGFILEKVFGESLDSTFNTRIAKPLKLKNTFFIPKNDTPKNISFVATEDSVWRKGVIRGQVHDDNAYVLGGVAGHAGLFSTVDDLHRFLTSFEIDSQLGWDTPSPQGSQAGQFFSKNSIGHLGYTGCSLWIDLEKDFHVILLTNRVHPTSKNEKIKEFRPMIHDLIVQNLK